MASQLAEKEPNMAKFGFGKKFNTEKLFKIETENFEYIDLEGLSLITKEDPDHVFIVRGIYINNKGMYDPQPVVALDDTYVNLPAHLTDVCKTIIADRTAVAAINNGECGFRITSYFKPKYNKTCYSVEWVDV